SRFINVAFQTGGRPKKPCHARTFGLNWSPGALRLPGVVPHSGAAQKPDKSALPYVPVTNIRSVWGSRCVYITRIASRLSSVEAAPISKENCGPVRSKVPVVNLVFGYNSAGPLLTRTGGLHWPVHRVI